MKEKHARASNVVSLGSKSELSGQADRVEVEWMRHTMHMQRMLAIFVCTALALSLISALGIFYLQGFHWMGFNLPENLMHWIGLATIGAIASLSSMVYGAFFERPLGENRGTRNRNQERPPEDPKRTNQIRPGFSGFPQF